MSQEKNLRQLQKQVQPTPTYRACSRKDAKEFQKRQEQLGTHILWQDSKDVLSCTQCKARFTISRRKHHCRSCGRIFCSTCSDFKVVLSGQLKRSCEKCSRTERTRSHTSLDASDGSDVIFSGLRKEHENLSASPSTAENSPSFFDRVFGGSTPAHNTRTTASPTSLQSPGPSPCSASLESFPPYVDAFCFFRLTSPEEDPLFLCERTPGTSPDLSSDILNNLKQSLLSHEFHSTDTFMKLNSRVLLRFPVFPVSGSSTGESPVPPVEKFHDEDGDEIGAPVLTSTEFFNCYVSLFFSPSSGAYQAFVIVSKWFFPFLAYEMIKKLHEALLHTIDSTFFKISLQEIQVIFLIAFNQTDLWPIASQNRGSKLGLNFFGDIFYLHIPTKPSIACLSPRTDNSEVLVRPRGPSSLVPANYNTNYDQFLSSVDLMSLLAPLGLVKHLWTIWEWLVLGKDLVILSSSPALCSELVLALVSLLLPVEQVGDFRPFVSSDDPSLLVLAATAQLKKELQRDGNSLPTSVQSLACRRRSMIIGVSNPNCLKLFEDFDAVFLVHPTYTNDITLDPLILNQYVLSGLHKTSVEHCLLSETSQETENHVPKCTSSLKGKFQRSKLKHKLKSSSFVRFKESNFYTAYKQWIVYLSAAAPPSSESSPKFSPSNSNSWIISRTAPSTYTINALIRRLRSLNRDNDLLVLGNKFIRSHFYELTLAYFAPTTNFVPMSSPGFNGNSPSPSSVSVVRQDSMTSGLPQVTSFSSLSQLNDPDHLENSLNSSLSRLQEEKKEERALQIKEQGRRALLFLEILLVMQEKEILACADLCSDLELLVVLSQALSMAVILLSPASPRVFQSKMWSNSCILYAWLVSTTIWLHLFHRHSILSSVLTRKFIFLDPSTSEQVLEELVLQAFAETQSKSQPSVEDSPESPSLDLRSLPPLASKTKSKPKSKTKVAKPPTPMKPNFSGIWQRTKHTNMEAFLVAQSIGYIQRKLVMSLNPLINIAMDPGGHVIRLKEKAGPIEADISYTIYKDWATASDPSLRFITNLAGTKFADIFYWDGDVLIQKKLLLPNHEYELVVYRSFVGPDKREILVRTVCDDLIKKKQTEAQFILAFQGKSNLPHPPLPSFAREESSEDDESEDEEEDEDSVECSVPASSLDTCKKLSLKAPTHPAPSPPSPAEPNALMNLPHISPRDMSGIWEQESSNNLEDFLRACGASYMQALMAPRLSFTHTLIMNPPYLNAIRMEERIGSMLVLSSEASIGLIDCNLELPLVDDANPSKNRKVYTQKAYWENDSLYVIRTDRELTHEIVFIRQFLESSHKKRMNFVAIFKNLKNQSEVRSTSVFVKIREASSSYNPVPNTKLVLMLKNYLKNYEENAQEVKDDSTYNNDPEEKIVYRLLDNPESFSNLSSSALNQLAAVPSQTTSKQGARFNGVWSPLRSSTDIMDQHISIDSNTLAIIEISLVGEIKSSLTLEINGDSTIEHLDGHSLGLDMDEEQSSPPAATTPHHPSITQYRTRCYWDSDSLVIHKTGERESFESPDPEIITEEWVTREIQSDGFSMSVRTNFKDLISSTQSQSTHYYARR